MRAGWLLLFALVALGCGSEETIEQPPSTGGAGGCAPGEASIDDSCRPAGIWTCAEGFVADGLGGCNPVLPAEMCGDGEMALPGEVACRPVMDCAPGRWGEAPVDATTEHVDGNYAGGASDGSVDMPWMSIQEGIDNASPGAIVAIAAGSYTEDLQIAGSPVRLWGACTSTVTILGSDAATASVMITTGAGGSEIRDLAIGAGYIGVALVGSEDILLDRVWIHDTVGRGVDVEDALGPSSLTLRRSLVEASTNVGVFVGGSTVTVDESIVRETRPTTTGDKGAGIVSQPNPSSGAPGTLMIARSVVQASHHIGVMFSGSHGGVDATVIQDVAPQSSDQRMGRGLTIELTDLIGTPSVVTVRNSVIGRTHELGVAVIGSEATIESTVVRDVVPQASDGAAGRGIGVEDHASTALPSKVTLRSSLVERTHDIGIMTQSSDTTLESVIVRDTQARQPDGWFGRGLHVQLSSMTLAPASLTVRSSLIDRNFEMGILVHGGHAAIETTLVRQTAARLDGLLGDGVAIHGGDSLTGQATIQGSRIEANARAGIVTFSASVALGSTTLECNTIQLDGENLLGPFALDDLGGNVCGCAGAQTQCAVVTTALEPPAPLD